MPNNQQPNPDDRSDNAAKLQTMVQNTLENIEEAEGTMALTEDPQQKQKIAEKNERRSESIDSMRAEIKDETSSH
ncbi:MAG: small acid-soluble spore protein Tlp [Bacillota bacterium]|nr:small acid-soluble spore protein Tlp [Bacillota bacterium]